MISIHTEPHTVMYHPEQRSLQKTGFQFIISLQFIPEIEDNMLGMLVSHRSITLTNIKWSSALMIIAIVIRIRPVIVIWSPSLHYV